MCYSLSQITSISMVCNQDCSFSFMVFNGLQPRLFLYLTNQTIVPILNYASEQGPRYRVQGVPGSLKSFPVVAAVDLYSLTILVFQNIR